MDYIRGVRTICIIACLLAIASGATVDGATNAPPPFLMTRGATRLEPFAGGWLVTGADGKKELWRPGIAGWSNGRERVQPMMGGWIEQTSGTKWLPSGRNGWRDGRGNYAGVAASGRYRAGTNAYTAGAAGWHKTR